MICGLRGEQKVRPFIALGNCLSRVLNIITLKNSGQMVFQTFTRPALASVYKGILHKTTKNGLPTY